MFGGDSALVGPGEAAGAGGEGEVAFDDAEVDLEAGAHETGLDADLASVPCDPEALLVDRGGGQKGGLDAPAEPEGRVVAQIADLGGGLALPGAALGLAVAEGDQDHFLFPLFGHGPAPAVCILS